MTQLTTLQDIYSKIADIYDKFCDLPTEINSSVTQDITLDGYSSTGITLENPDNKSEITDAETNINALINLALSTAQQNRLSTDAQSQGSNGDLVPIPDGSPIALLPKLINILVGFNAPLKVILQILSDYIGSILLEQIKRRLNETKPEIYGTVSTDKSIIIKVPSDALQMLVRVAYIQEGASKRYEPKDLNKGVYGAVDDLGLDRYTRFGLGAVSFGLKASIPNNATFMMWKEEIQIQFTSQLFDIPEYSYTSPDRYTFVFLEYSCYSEISFVKGVKLVNP